MLNPMDMIRQAAEAAAERVDAPASEVRGVILDETRHQTEMLLKYQRLLLLILAGVIIEVAVFLGGGAYMSQRLLSRQERMLSRQATILEHQTEILSNQDSLKVRLARVEAQQ